MEFHLKKIAIALMLLSGASAAQEAYVQLPFDMRVGDKASVLMYPILYVDLKCDLPLIHAQHMRRYERFDGRNLEIGCWGKSLGDRAVVVLSTGETHTEDLPSLYRAKISKNKEATVTAMPSMQKN